MIELFLLTLSRLEIKLMQNRFIMKSKDNKQVKCIQCNYTYNLFRSI